MITSNRLSYDKEDGFLYAYRSIIIDCKISATISGLPFGTRFFGTVCNARSVAFVIEASYLDANEKGRRIHSPFRLHYYDTSPCRLR